jgi:hypothetical protein
LKATAISRRAERERNIVDLDAGGVSGDGVARGHRDSES